MHDINLCEAKFTAGLKGSFASISSSPRQKTPKKAVQAMAQRTTFLGFDEVSRILIWESTGVVMGSPILGGVLRISLAWRYTRLHSLQNGKRGVLPEMWEAQ